jgi:chromate reductase, NAD(P)H dehydrogenase (quinone)
MGLKVLCFAGSARRDSLNKKLAQVAALLIDESGATTTWLDLNDYPLPIYHGDFEATQGIPDPVTDLAAILAAHPAWLIASPENNVSVSALLKNTIDWLSRLKGNDVFRGRTVALTAASPGAFGGVRGLYHLRAVLNSLGAEVIAAQMVLPAAHKAFSADGQLVDPRSQTQLREVVQQLLRRAGG